jgi:hypothetical protein
MSLKEQEQVGLFAEALEISGNIKTAILGHRTGAIVMALNTNLVA